MRARYFYLEDGVNKVDLMEVGAIASFAISLEATNMADMVTSHYEALCTYMNNNKNNILFNCFNLLNSDLLGRELLMSNIGICFFEKSFRENGADKDSINSYVSIFNKYHELLNERMEFEEDKPKSLR